MRSSAHLSITAQESSGNPTAHLAAGNPIVAGTSNFGLDTHLLLSSLPLEKTTNMYDSTAARTADADNSTVNDTIGNVSITNAAAVKTEPVNTPPGGTVDISTPHAEVFSTGSVTVPSATRSITVGDVQNLPTEMDYAINFYLCQAQREDGIRFYRG